MREERRSSEGDGNPSQGDPKGVTAFRTGHGVDVPAVTAAQMREVDRIATDETGPNLFQMMENAGRNLAELSIELLGEKWNRASVLILAGAGGNGGGGLVAARHLANHGADVRVCLARPDGLEEVPRWQRRVLRSTSAREISPSDLQGADLVIDALLGYGMHGPPHGAEAELITWVNGSGSHVLSLDVPSGVDATTGEAPGAHVAPRWTMTLALPKTGLRSNLTGDLLLADIGIPAEVYRRLGLHYRTPFAGSYRVPIAACGQRGARRL